MARVEEQRFGFTFDKYIRNKIKRKRRVLVTEGKL